MKSGNWYESIGPVERQSEKESPKLRAMTATEQIAQRLRDYRKTWRLSQAKLAKKAGTTQRVISLLETGRYNPSLDLVERVMAACGMRVVVSFERKVTEDRHVS
jgi:DNA-binding XRE family transcriptional regulator